MSKQLIPPPIDPELQPELDILDESNPRSLVNLLPGKMGDSLRKIPLSLLTKTETELKRLGKINLVEERLRQAFWMEYNYAQLGQRVINMPNIYNGVCRKEYWWQHILTDPYKMAFIFTPPPAHRVQLKHLLEVGLDQIMDILKRDHILRDENGMEIGTDAKLAGTKVKIVEGLMNRVHGSITQKVQTESKSLSAVVEVGKEDSLEEIDRKIRETEAALGGRAVKDVKEISVSQVRDAQLEGSGESDDQG